MSKLEEMLYHEINSRKINQKDLCRGICSTSALSRYLRGERKIDRLLLNALMQRLGRAPDKFITVLSEEEYKYFNWRQNVCYAQVTEQWKLMEKLLKEEKYKGWKCNQAIQEQFSLMMESIVQERLYSDRAKSLKLAETAIAKTMFDITESKWNCVLLSVQEIGAILLWQSLQKDKNAAQKVLQFLLDYIVSHSMDEQQLERMYPQIAASYVSLLYEEGQYYDCISISEKALKMIISTGYSAGLTQILEINVAAVKKLNVPKVSLKRRKQLDAWKELFAENRSKKQKDNTFVCMLDAWEEIELAGEIISLSRMEKGLTQEQLSNDICTPENLSRIEAGKQTPTRKNYSDVMKRLSLKAEYYYSKIETDDFSVLELKWQLEKKIMNRDWNGAQIFLKELERAIDISSNANKQYVEEKSYVIDNCMGKIEAQERLPRLIRILKYTVKEIPMNTNIYAWGEVLEKHPFNAEEISVMIHIADALYAQKKTMQAVEVLENVMTYYRNSRIKLEFHYRTILLIMARLSAWYSILPNYQKALKYSDEGIEMLIASGNSKMLGLFLNNKANALEHLGRVEESLRYYRLAFYCADLLEQKSAIVSKNSYEKLSGEETSWY